MPVSNKKGQELIVKGERGHNISWYPPAIQPKRLTLPAVDLLQHPSLLSCSRPILSILDQAKHLPSHEGSYQVQASASVDSVSWRKTMPSLLDVVHEVPELLEVLLPEELKTLSATCRSVRTSFCARVRVISLADPADAMKLCCTTWPQLLMVVSTSGVTSKLSAQWHYLVDVTLEWSGPLFTRTHETAVLVRPHKQLHSPLTDLPSQYCDVLSGFTDKHRHKAKIMELRGPFVGCSVIQALTRDIWPAEQKLKLASQQLGVESMSHLSDSLHSLTYISVRDSSLDARAHSNLGTRWPQLQDIALCSDQLDLSVISALTQAKWAHLYHLTLIYSMLDVTGLRHLRSGSLPELRFLSLICLVVDIDGASLAQDLAQGLCPALQCLTVNGQDVLIDADGTVH